MKRIGLYKLVNTPNFVLCLAFDSLAAFGIYHNRQNFPRHCVTADACHEHRRRNCCRHVFRNDTDALKRKHKFRTDSRKNKYSVV